MSAASQSENSVMDRVDSLRRQLAGLVTLDEDEKPVISWGCTQLDQFMPGSALRPGMIVELLYEQHGSGASSLAMHCAKHAVRMLGGPFVVVDRGRRFYPPAAIARGVESKDLIVVRSSDSQMMSSAEELWSLDQALRCAGVSVVMAWVDRLDPNAYRRLQLAAEAGQTLALLIRPERVRAFPTWADVQLLVSPRASQEASENRQLRVMLSRQRGRAGGNVVEGAELDLEMNEIEGTLKISARAGNRNEARTMHMAPRVAHPAARRRSAGA